MRVVGQEHLTKEINKIIEIFIASNGEIKPHFMLTGPSGSGKTLSMQSIAANSGVSFLEINAAALTKEGTSGNSLSKALSPLLQAGTKPMLVFVDEFDKLFISGNSNGDLAHESTNGVQNEFLKVLEGTTAQVFGDYGKYSTISTKNILFIFSGAFNGEENITLDRLREFGIKTEFLGRVGLVYNARPLTLDNLYEILDESEILEKYLTLFPSVDRDYVVALIRAYLEQEYEKNVIGARLINTLVSQYFIKGSLPEKEVKKIAFQNTLTM